MENAPHRPVMMIMVCHGLTGLITAVWGAGLPATDARLDLGPARLGTVLLILAAGALIAMSIMGRLLARLSGARALRVTLPVAAATLAVAGSMPSVAALMIAAGGFGLACGALNVALSTRAVEIERALGRPVIARLHGCWTLGATAGGLLVAGALRLGLDGRLVITGGAVLLAVLSMAVTASAVPSAERAGSVAAVPPAERAGSVAEVPVAIARVGGRPVGGGWRLVVLGLLGAAAFVAEGAATDWSGLHATRVLGADPAAGSVAYALFFGAMTVVRFLGDAVRARLGAPLTVRIAGSVAGGGLLLVLLAGAAPLGLTARLAAVGVGWTLAGAGMAVVWPVVISTLGSAGADAARLSVVTMISYGGGLVGPALIGYVAAAAGLTVALIIPALLALLVAACAPPIVLHHLTRNRPGTRRIPINQGEPA